MKLLTFRVPIYAWPVTLYIHQMIQTIAQPRKGVNEFALGHCALLPRAYSIT